MTKPFYSVISAIGSNLVDADGVRVSYYVNQSQAAPPPPVAKLYHYFGPSLGEDPTITIWPDIGSPPPLVDLELISDPGYVAYVAFGIYEMNELKVVESRDTEGSYMEGQTPFETYGLSFSLGAVQSQTNRRQAATVGFYGAVEDFSILYRSAAVAPGVPGWYFADSGGLQFIADGITFAYVMTIDPVAGTWDMTYTVDWQPTLTLSGTLPVDLYTTLSVYGQSDPLETGIISIGEIKAWTLNPFDGPQRETELQIFRDTWQPPPIPKLYHYFAPSLSAAPTITVWPDIGGPVPPPLSDLILDSTPGYVAHSVIGIEGMNFLRVVQSQGVQGSYMETALAFQSYGLPFSIGSVQSQTLRRRGLALYMSGVIAAEMTIGYFNSAVAPGGIAGWYLFDDVTPFFIGDGVVLAHVMTIDPNAGTWDMVYSLDWGADQSTSGTCAVDFYTVLACFGQADPLETGVLSIGEIKAWTGNALSPSEQLDELQVFRDTWAPYPMLRWFGPDLTPGLVPSWVDQSVLAVNCVNAFPLTQPTAAIGINDLLTAQSPAGSPHPLLNFTLPDPGNRGVGIAFVCASPPGTEDLFANISGTGTGIYLHYSDFLYQGLVLANDSGTIINFGDGENWIGVVWYDPLTGDWESIHSVDGFPAVVQSGTVAPEPAGYDFVGIVSVSQPYTATADSQLGELRYYFRNLALTPGEQLAIHNALVTTWQAPPVVYVNGGGVFTTTTALMVFPALAGLQVGDLLVFEMSFQGGSSWANNEPVGNVIPPGGSPLYVSWFRSPAGGSNGMRTWYKRATLADVNGGAGITHTFTLTTPNFLQIGQILAYRNVHHVGAIAFKTGASTTWSVNSLAVDNNRSKLVTHTLVAGAQVGDGQTLRVSTTHGAGPFMIACDKSVMVDASGLEAGACTFNVWFTTGYILESNQGGIVIPPAAWPPPVGTWWLMGPPVPWTGGYFTQGWSVSTNGQYHYVAVTNFIDTIAAPLSGIWRNDNYGDPANWVQVSGFIAGPVPVGPVSPINIRIDPADSLHIYVSAGVRGASSMGFWRSSNGGALWDRPAGFLSVTPNQDVYQVTTEPGDFTKVLLSYHSAWPGTPGKSGLLYSADSGTTWAVILGPPTMNAISANIAYLYDPVAGVGNNQTLFFPCQSDGQYRSIDFGATWTKVTTIGMGHGGSQTFWDVAAAKWFTTSENGILSSPDGIIWTLIGPAPVETYLALAGGIQGGASRLWTLRWAGNTFAVRANTLTPTVFTRVTSFVFTAASLSGAFQMVWNPATNRLFSANQYAGFWVYEYPP